MLQLVFGRNYADKTEYLRNLAAEKIKSRDGEIIFIIPEQFSYETEKGMLEKIGSAGMQRLEVLSLSRLAELCLERAGKSSSLRRVDDAVRMLTMNLALAELSDGLEIFKKYGERPALTESLVSFATELKQCSVGVDELEAYAEIAEQSSLTAKLGELNKIISLYNAMLERDFYDPEDALTQLVGVLEDFNFFSDKTVIIDEFSRFTKQELGVIEKILSQSPEVYISFLTDGDVNSSEFGVFANINRQISLVKNCAQKNGVKILKPIFISDSENTVDENLLRLEKNIFLQEKDSFPTDPEAVEILCASDKSDECSFVALKIKKLLRQGLARGRDIAVYQREKDSYDEELSYAFKKYGVPFYEDRRQPVDAQPLMVYLRTLLNICVNGISTDTVLRLLKTGLCQVTDDEIANLENYAFVWQIKASQWKNDFTENPRGFGSELRESDEAALDSLNETRRKIIGPLLSFRKEFNNALSEEKAKLLFEFIKKQGVKDALFKMACRLSDDGCEWLYEEQDAVWSLAMDMIDRLYLAGRGINVSSKKFAELFDLLLSVCDLGVLPQGLDCVTVAAADRSRIGTKKYVFAVGANEGEFPKDPSTQGLLNDRDRKTLKQYGIELAETAEYKQVEERFIAYRTVCSATERLFVSHYQTGLRGEAYTPSEIIREIKAVFTEIDEESYDMLPESEKVESRASAFEAYARSYNLPSAEKSTLHELLSEYPDYSGRLESLERCTHKSVQQIKDGQTATRLFGKNMELSASKTETYHNCPFKYFCRYGVNASARKPASVDSLLSGTIIHEAFEKILSEYDRQALEGMDDSALKSAISEILKNYLNEKMGGAQNKTKRFLQQYDGISEQIFTILKRIIEEFKSCEFVPVDFELPIGRTGIIEPYNIKLDDGGMLSVSGSVDRVDVMEKNGKKFLRVVDYKSGGKDFNLYDVFYGLSTQMLIYLFAIYTGGAEKYGEIVPSGVFYMSAKPDDSNLGRNADQSEIDKKRLSSNKMSGIVVDDMEIAEGMEKELKGVYIPVKVDKDGKLKGALISYENLMLLKREIDDVLKATAESLHKGDIRVLPSDPSRCKNCDYKYICGFEDGDEALKIDKISNEKAFELLKEKYGEDKEAENG